MHGDMTFGQILQISFVLPILLVLGVIMSLVVIERWFYFLRHAGGSNSALDHIRSSVKNGHMAEAKSMALRHSAFIFQAIAAQIDAVNMPRNERESLVLFYHQRFQSLLQKRLWIFGTLSFICPLVGLFGTVLGVMTSFKDLALSGSGGPSIVAAGISEALYATAAGITVAIMAAIIYNWFNIWMKNALANIDIFSQEIIFLTVGRHAK